MDEQLRSIGFEAAGLAPWGAHVCLFYHDQAELVEALALYFKAGLENNELCVWVASDQASKEQARRAIERALPGSDGCGLARYRRLGQLEILDYREWYIRNGLGGVAEAAAAESAAPDGGAVGGDAPDMHFSTERIFQSWRDKEREARRQGFDGLRAAGDTAWLKVLFQGQQIAWNHEVWNFQMEYESRAGCLMHPPGFPTQRPHILALCTYNLNQCSPTEIAKAAANHELVLIREPFAETSEIFRDRTPGDGWRAIFNTVYDQAEEAMEVSQKSYQALVQSSSDHIFMLGLDGAYLTSNDRVAQFGLQTGAELAGRKLEEVYPPEIAESYRQQLERVIATGMAVEFEHPTSEAGGERTHLDLLYPIFRYGLVSVVGGVCRDISERKHAEQLQMERERSLQVALHSAESAIYAKDRQLRYTLVNPAMLELLDRQESELVGKTDVEIFGSAAIRLEQADQRALKGEMVQEEYFLPVGKEAHIIQVSRAPLRDENGAISGLTGSLRDVTDSLREQDQQQHEPDANLFNEEVRVSLEEIKRQNEQLTQDQQKIEMERQRYQWLFQTAPIPYLVSDASGGVIEANRAAEDLLHCRADFLVGKPLLVFVAAADRPAVYQALSQRLLAGQPLTLEIGLLPRAEKAGELAGQIEVEATLSADLDANGQIRRILWLLHNMTVPRQDAARLRLQADLLDSVSEAVVASDANYCLIYWNKAAEQLYGWQSAEVLGRLGLEVTQTEFPGIDKQEMLTGIQRSGGWVGEASQAHRDGERFPVELHSLVLKDENGDVRGYISVNHDIRERLQARAALEASEKRYANLFNHMQEGFAYCQMVYEPGPTGEPRACDFIYLKVNQAFSEITGLKQVVGQPVSALIPGVHQANPELLEIYGRVALTGQPERFETYLPGLEIWFNVAVYNYEIGYFAAVFENITESKRREQALCAALAEKETLLKEVHHRVKNNLAVVTSLLDLQSRASPDAGLKAALADNQQRIQAMLAIHEQLYHSKNLAQIDMRQYVPKLVEQVQALYNRPDVRWQLDIGPVTLDLEQAIPCGLILSELATNALKHAFGARNGGNGLAHEPPTVQINFQPDGQGAGGQRYILQVSDNGSGLPPDFDPAKTRQVGMRLLQGLAGQLGGRLELGQPQAGSAFSITFPEGRSA